MEAKVRNLVAEAIGNVGVGKRGSKTCSPELVEALSSEIQAGNVTAAALGAFYGALFKKGIEPEEQKLLGALSVYDDNPEAFASALLPDVPHSIYSMAMKLLSQQDLTFEESEELGDYLLSSDAAPKAQGFFASVLRVKYETMDEYCGLLTAMNKTCLDLSSVFDNTSKLVQLAEPFDGLNRSHLITPIISDMLNKRGYSTVSLGGRNAGPKYGNNTQALAQVMDEMLIVEGEFNARDNEGYFIRQKDLSPALDSWVEIRQEIIKRPFVATLEKLVNPCGASIGFFSAFHAPYAEKMVDLALLNGFSAALSVFKSMEGSLGLATDRSCQIICGVKKTDGSIEKKEFNLSPEDLGCEPFADSKLEDVSIAQTAELISTYLETGDSGDDYFNARATITLRAYAEVLDWIEEMV